MKSVISKEWKKWTTLTAENALYDRTLVWLFLALLSIGLIIVTSASIPVSTRLYQDPFHFAVRHGIYVAMAIIVFFVCLNIPSAKWEKWNFAFFMSSLFLLFLVLVIGKNVNGATRWIPIGPIHFQPAELAKLAVICYFANFYVKHFDDMRTKHLSSVRPMIILAIFSGLLLLQPDLGSTAVIFVLTFAMLFIMGAKLWQFLLLIITGIMSFIFLVVSSEYRLKRVTSFLDPFADAFGDGFQLSNSQMAFGQGELFGRGLGNSVQKLEYLPEAHTDFVMAVVAEEFGLFGIVFIVILLTVFTLRALLISREALKQEERFKGFFAFGIAIWIFLQGFVNLGVASGLLPTKGLTFPLISYGGSSMIIMAIAVSILVRIDHENRITKVGHATLNED